VYEDLEHAVRAWSQAWAGGAERPTLTYWSAPGYLRIYDTRQPGSPGTYAFRGALADIYLACVDRPTTASAVRERLSLELPVEAVQDVLGEFAGRGLMFLDGSLALALALPAIRGR
jgi:hypothetical protein